MKVLFIEVDTERAWAVASLGPATIAAWLRRHGHEVEFFRAAVDADPEVIAQQAAERSPGLIGLSLTSRQWLRALELAGPLSRVAPIIAGGLHPTFAPEDVLAHEAFSYVCLGEGEEAMLDLVSALEAGRPDAPIANIQRKGEARPPLRPPFSPLDDMPFAARDLLDEHPGCLHLTTQRGCPFPCTYCAARTTDDLYADVAPYGRRRSIDSVLEEVHQLRREAGLSYAIFLDDTFTIHHPWVKEFCSRWRREGGPPFSLHARVETVSRELIAELASAGCRHITYGVESGSERIRREVMKRPVTNRRFREVFRWTRDAGILVTANYMLGVPGETREDLDATLQLAEELAADDFGFFVFYPYPGTQLYRLCQERGYLPPNPLELPANNRRSILRLPELSTADIEDAYERFTRLRERLYEAREETAAARRGSAPCPTATEHVRTSAANG